MAIDHDVISALLAALDAHARDCPTCQHARTLTALDDDRPSVDEVLRRLDEAVASRGPYLVLQHVRAGAATGPVCPCCGMFHGPGHTIDHEREHCSWCTTEYPPVNPERTHP
jgi:hypothetical protein